MKITLLQVGKTKEKAYIEIENEFKKRLTPFCSLETVTIKTSDFEEENKALQSKIPEHYTVVALDLKGKALSSEEFATWLKKQRDFEGGKVVFMIGGPHGLSPQTLSRAHTSISLSRMTFTHQMARLFVLEQLYRAFMILANKTYHSAQWSQRPLRNIK